MCEFLPAKQRGVKESPTRWLANRVRFAGAFCPGADGEPRKGFPITRDRFWLGVCEKGEESIIAVGFDAWLLMRLWVTMACKWTRDAALKAEHPRSLAKRSPHGQP